MGHQTHESGELGLIAAQLHAFSRRLDHSHVPVPLAPDAPLAEQLAQLQEAVLAELARCRQNEDALRASEARLRTILGTLPVGVLLTDQEGEVTESNGLVERICLSPADTVPSPRAYRHCPAQWSASGQPVNTGEWPSDIALHTGEVVLNQEIDLQRTDGERVTILDSSAPLRDAEGQITGAVVVVQDITDRKRAEEALRTERSQLRAILDNAPVLISMKDLHGTMILANRAIYEHLAVPPPEAFLGRSVFELFPAEVAEQLWANDLAALHSDEPVCAEEMVQHRDGSWHTYLTVKFPVRYVDTAEPFGVCAISLDITDRKQLEEELRTLTATLEQRVHERTAALEAANKELEAFSYSVSHDLRAPLRSLDGFSKILQDKYAEQIDARGQDYLARIRAAALRMGRLIDDMLRLSRIGRTELRRAPVNLSVLALAVAAELRQREPERLVRVDVAPDLEVNGDADLLRIALENLIGNAWKFTGKTPDARIEVGSMTRDGECIYYVRDNGAGFDMSYADKLFSPFQRLHGEEEFPGTGIGLAIVQRIIARHGGRIWAEGQEGHGATVYFTLGTAGA